MSLINDLAHRYGFDDEQIQMVRETSEKMAASLIWLGVGGIEKTWLTATENFANVNYSYNKGYFDGQKNVHPCGHWITHNPNNPFTIYGECSHCGFKPDSMRDKFNYCPYCGAKMDVLRR